MMFNVECDTHKKKLLAEQLSTWLKNKKSIINMNGVKLQQCIRSLS